MSVSALLRSELSREHEYYSYRNHLIGDQVSIEGRILAVADVVEAMSSYRPYRPALGIEVALAEIARGRGTIYDAAIVDPRIASHNFVTECLTSSVTGGAQSGGF